MDTLTFYRSLLCALRAHRPRFVAAGEDFHGPFAEVLRRELAHWPAGERPPFADVKIDPIFGVCRQAEEMLLEGEQDLVLSLMNPRHRTAIFKINEVEAEAELARLPAGVRAWFLEVGRALHAQLSGGGTPEPSAAA